MKRGTLYWVNLGPTHPPEFGKVRPGLIVSNSEQNILLPTIVIIPISSAAPEIWPLRLSFEMPNSKKSYLVLPGIRQVSKARLQEAIGSLSTTTMSRVDEAIGAYLHD